jgi:uncharacterized protein YcfJ
MNSNQIEGNNSLISRIHPLVAVAAASVIVVSLLGAAAITGVLPSSKANAPAALTASELVQAKEEANAAVPQKSLNNHTHVQQPSTKVASASNAPAQTPAVTAPVPAAPAKNSPVGIGIGAVVGGLLGNQVGSGDGKTLATIAGAVGGGYVGNEIAKKQNP